MPSKNIMPSQCLTIVLAERPETYIIPGKTFSHKVEPPPMDIDVKEGQLLIESLYLSLDPAMRGWLNGTPCFPPPFFNHTQSSILDH